ncbi:hypothetical protein BKP42_61010 [Rhodococcus erythropolis]|nr:hypothetical protein BKP42_61010 [Rhodococcus erythropolis]
MSAWRCSTARTLRPCSPTTASKTFLRCPMPLCTSGIRRTDVLIPVEAIDSTMARYCEAGVPVTSDESLRTRPPLGGGNRPTRRSRSSSTTASPASLRPRTADTHLRSPTTESRAHHEHRNTILTLDDHGMCPHGRAPRGSSFNQQTCGGPSVRYPTTTNSSSSPGRIPKARASSTRSSTTTAVFEDRPASPAIGYETDDQIARSLSDLVDGRSEVSRRPSRWAQTRIAAVLLPVSPPNVDGEQR